jgi:hypothetical protein
MNWLTKIARALGQVLGIVQKSKEIADEVEDFTGTMPSRQLGPEDVRRQQAQIARATSFKVPPRARH